MALGTYRKKRRFGETTEPKGARSRKAGDSFVVQKHDARRLHYDLRLEMDGVLKSWAVTRGPSLTPGEKRLAVHVEDHPLDYAGFEGIIPEGHYGAGSVIVWDKGRWTPIGDPRKSYAKGKLDFELHGEKLAGRWHLVRMRGKPREKKENWLLIKGDDEESREAGDPDILEVRPESVKTGRKVEEVGEDRPPKKKRKSASPAREKPKLARAKKAAMPDSVEPEMATLVRKSPSGGQWIHEIKFDGYRIQARLEGGKVKLLTRGGLDWTTKFGKALPNALTKLPSDSALVDGEVVVERENGASDFSALQAALSEGRTDRFVFYAFDLLYLDGRDLRRAGLLDRKQALEGLLPEIPGVIRYSEHFDQDGETILRHACRLSLEGMVSKKRDAPYRSGRGKDWVKSKCMERQEFVIGGYVPSTVSDKAIGSLALGYYKDGELQHVGRVGTGFSAALARDVFKRLSGLKVKSSPFDVKLSAEAARNLRFVEPTQVAEVEFRGWTADGNLRQASFRGLRDDKSATEIVREDMATETKAAKRPAVKLTHPDRVYWPDAGVTKEGLADYYVEMWPWIAPFVVGRPLSLVRCPGGISKQCFFQKHAWKGLNKAIRTVPDPADKDGEQMLVIDDLAGLIGLVQAGVLEIHPWGSSLAALEKPDMVIFDLDPGPGVEWPDLISASFAVRDHLQALGMKGFVKTSGGKGLHVTVPLEPKADWTAVKAFAKGVADAMAADDPQRYVSTVTKSKRRGKIFVDYLRNARGQTAVAPYSTRSRPGASVSMPLEWDELDDNVGPSYFTVANAVTRQVNLKRAPWEDFRKAATRLPKKKG